MQAGRTAPSFSSFIPQSSDVPRINGKRSPAQRDDDDETSKRHRSDKYPKQYSSPSRRKEHSTRQGSRKSLSGHRYDRHGSSHRSSPSKGTFDSPRRYLGEPRAPPNYDLPDTGSSYYDDRLGSTSSLYLEVRWYHLDGCRYILGAPVSARLFRNTRTQKCELYIPTMFSKNRAYTLKAFKLSAKSKTRRLVPSTKNHSEEAEDFIPVKRKAPASVDHEPSYRSITDVRKEESGASDSEDSDGDGLDLSDSDEEAPDAYVTETARLARILAADPTNIQSWLNVIAHTASTNPTQAGRADIWVTMLEKAMNNHPKNKLSTALRLRYLGVIREARGSEAEDMAWENALREIHDENLWLEYLNYRLGKFGLDSLVDTLHALRKRVESVQLDERRKYYIQLRLLWRSIVALKEAGYLEKAHATLQAQIELLYFRPSVQDSVGFEVVLDNLEEFWDSETPRVGEPQAEGWVSWMKNESSNPCHLSPRRGLDITNLHRETDGYRRWYDAETALDEARWLPAHEGDEDDDPYSMVMFSDVRPLLFPPSPISDFSESSPGGVEELLPLLVFVHFMGLHVPGLSDALLPQVSETEIQGVDTPWSYRGPMFDISRIGSLFSLPGQVDKASLESASSSIRQRWTSADEFITGKERKMGLGWGPVKEWTLSLVGWLEGFGTRGEGRMWEASDLVGVDVQFLRRMFQQVDSRLKSQTWSELWIAFEAAVDVKESLRVSKSILSSFSTSLRLWTGHAQLQRLRGKPDLARKVYQTCLASPQDAMKMWYSWAETEWLDGKDSAATRVLCSACGVLVHQLDSDMRIPILRARQAYTRALSSSSTLGEVLVPLLSAYALLELLQTGDVPRILQLYAQQISGPSFLHDSGRLRRRIREAIVYSSANLVYHYTITLKNNCPRIHLRKYVTDLMGQYPSNTLLLGVWLESERGEALWGRVRNGISDVILGGGEASGTMKTIGVPRWLWSLWVEKWERGAWDVNRVRSMLRKAVEVPSLRQSPTLWKVLLQLEIRTGHLREAQRIFYQAVKSCPWCKEFYLLAFGPLRSRFDAAELEQILNAMAERGVRLRADNSLEDYLREDRVEHTEAEHDVDGSEGGRQDWADEDVEMYSQELKRLKPY